MNKFTTLGLCALTLLLGSCDGDAAEGGESGTADKTASAAAFLQADAQYSDFWALVELGGLADRLGGTEKITVFAPTKKAFDSAGQMLEAASASKEAAAAFVNKYLVGGARKLGDLQAGELATMGGTKLDVEIEDHGDHSHAHISGVHIDHPDNAVGNGIVHGMNTLFP